MMTSACMSRKCIQEHKYGDGKDLGVELHVLVCEIVMDVLICLPQQPHTVAIVILIM